MLTHAQLQQFKIDGYLVLPKLFNEQTIQQIRETTAAHLEQRIEPFELETDVNYPGAPMSKNAEGGKTIRRLKMAFQRSDTFKKAALHPDITSAIKQILGGKSLFLNPNHHNCVMTKQPAFSSATHWHRDTRYWHFNNKYLINAWTALGEEKEANGCMTILPGSHRWDVRTEALDAAQFLIENHPDNQWRLDTARLVKLNAGDVLLFSAHCFHAAGTNRTNDSKYSMVFTFHNEQTTPILGSKSAKLKSVDVSQSDKTV